MSNGLLSSFNLQPSSSSTDQTKPSPFNVSSTRDFTTTESPIAGPSTFSYSKGCESIYPLTPLNGSVGPKGRTVQEQQIINQTNARFVSRLASDHAAVLYPDIDAPFVDVVDLTNRLLPYHVFQQPREDLVYMTTSCKGKGKAVEDELRSEIIETKFALECFERRQALETRFHKVMIRSDKRPAPNDQAFVLAQAVLDADRSETTSLNNELRTVRAELERREKDKRIAASSSRNMYYGTVSCAPMPSTQAQYYRGYPYAYAQVYGASVQPSSTSTFSISNNHTPVQSGGAIPVQLPVASLPALHALGIIPVPAASLPPDGHPQPPAVLRGSSSNGTMLSLEINVSLLQSSQMSGLAMVLNSLMSKSNSGNLANYSASSSGTLSSPTGDDIKSGG